MLSHVHLQRFKKFQDVEVYLKPFTVLMGENSSGKTTVLQAINLGLDSLARYKFVDFDNKGNVKIRDRGVGLTTLSSMSISDFRELYYAKVSAGGGAKKLAGGANLEIFDEKNNNYKLQIRSLFGGFNIKCVSTAADLYNDPVLHRKSPLFISGFVGLLSLEERAFPVAIQDRLRSGQVSSIIRNLLLDTKEKHPESFDRLKARLEKDFDFHLDEISFDEDQDLNVTAHYSDLCGINRVSLDFNSSGSGFMQVLQILAPIYRFCPDKSEIVLLDEPDAHLHPNLQASLASTLRDIQKELDIQIIISTHSTSIIRSADPSEVVPISSKAHVNRPLISSEDVEEHISARIDTYDLGKSVISGKLVFLEDSDTSIIETFDKVLGTKCFSGANTVPVLRGRSKDDKVPFQLSDVLKKFIGTDVEIHFIRDGDGLDTNWRSDLFNYASKANVNLHQLERHEIENYLLIPQLIFRVLRKKYPDKEVPGESEIRNKIESLLKQTVQLSKYRFDGNLEDTIRKTSYLLKKDNFYRDPNACEKEAVRLREAYENFNDFEDLVKVGMGKETLKGIFHWINNDLKLNLSRNDLLNGLEATDIPSEIHQILKQLKSKESKSSPKDFPEITKEDVFEDIIEEEFLEEEITEADRE